MYRRCPLATCKGSICRIAGDWERALPSHVPVKACTNAFVCILAHSDIDFTDELLTCRQLLCSCFCHGFSSVPAMSAHGFSGAFGLMTSTNVEKGCIVCFEKYVEWSVERADCLGRNIQCRKSVRTFLKNVQTVRSSC